MSDRPLIDGVRVDPGVSALARWRAERGGATTFARLADAPRDRRSEQRRPARLKWGKALDHNDRFLCECVLSNRSIDGARLRLTRNITLPQKFQLYEDDSGALFDATIVWRRGVEIGCRLSRAPTQEKGDVVKRMQGRYYAM